MAMAETQVKTEEELLEEAIQSKVAELSTDEVQRQMLIEQVKTNVYLHRIVEAFSGIAAGMESMMDSPMLRMFGGGK